MTERTDDKPRQDWSEQETFANGEYRFKLGDQWYYRGNRSSSWFYVASRVDGSCQGGIAEKVPEHLWAFLNDTGDTIAGLKAMGHAVVNTIREGQGSAPRPSLGATDVVKAARAMEPIYRKNCKTCNGDVWTCKNIGEQMGEPCVAYTLRVALSAPLSPLAAPEHSVLCDYTGGWCVRQFCQRKGCQAFEVAGAARSHSFTPSERELKYEAALRHIAETGFAEKDWKYARDALETTVPTTIVSPPVSSRAPFIEEARLAYEAHTHRASPHDADQCADCGHNFRDPVHLRVGESKHDRLMAFKGATALSAIEPRKP